MRVGNYQTAPSAEGEEDDHSYGDEEDGQINWTHSLQEGKL